MTLKKKIVAQLDLPSAEYIVRILTYMIARVDPRLGSTCSGSCPGMATNSF